jgi:CheY-like chemotaxis protein
MYANTNKIKILHLENNAEDAWLIEAALTRGQLHCEILVVSTRAEFIVALRNFAPDIILSDHLMDDLGSLDALAIVQYSGFKIPFILVSGNKEEYMVRLNAQGMNDYIMKDRLQRLPGAIVNAIWHHSLEARLLKLRDSKEGNSSSYNTLKGEHRA